MGELHDCAQEQRLSENGECATKYSLNVHFIVSFYEIRAVTVLNVVKK